MGRQSGLELELTTRPKRRRERWRPSRRSRSLQLEQRMTDMPKDAHNKAAEHHENAAKSHKMAAEHHGKGEHWKGREE